VNGTVTTWSVDIQLGERDGHTHAEARLITGVEPPLHASGDARLSEKDPVDVPEIGFELATARALADVLLKTAREDVEAVAGDEDGYHSETPTGAW
jgi:hypothetical protein